MAHLGRVKEAIADMDEAIRCAPSEPRWFARRGELYFLQRDFEAALASFESALRLDPEDVSAHCGRARIFISRGRTGLALSDITEAISRRPDSARLFLARAIVRLEISELEEAVDDCAESMRLRRDFPGPYAVRGMLEFSLGLPQAALAFAELALQLDSKLPLPYQIRGRVFEARQDYAEAIVEFDRARARDSEYVPPLVWRALAVAHAGFPQVATRDLEETVRRFPGSADSHLMLAWFLATSPHEAFRDGPRAVAEAELGVELAQESAYALDVLAIACAEAGDFARARELETQALDKTPARSTDCYRFAERLAAFERETPYRDPR